MSQALADKGALWGVGLSSAAFAERMDAEDPLAALRREYHVPTLADLGGECAAAANSDEECVYLCGNSLGLQPTGTKQLVVEELDKWARRGVNGHMDDSARPWVSIDKHVIDTSAKIVGAKPEEVAIMNTLTVNLHFLMVPFYRPTKDRYKIIMEAKAFPSDYFALCSQIKLHGRDPADALIEVHPREGEHCIREDDICDMIAKEGSSVALVLFSGVQFYNGQFFDLERITKAGHKQGCLVGFDLAHAVGNVVLQLHDWDVDFACWCTYKYLNSGPGGIAGAFVHEKHSDSVVSKGLIGWWGVDLKTRFDMDYEPNFVSGVKGLQLSNPGVLQTVSLLGSLQVFEKTSMAELRAKSLLLTAYLEALVALLGTDIVTVITPTDPERRGCQLSLLFAEHVEPMFKELERRGVVCDLRKPNVLRIAPAPMYNSFKDVFRFIAILKECMAAVHKA